MCIVAISLLYTMRFLIEDHIKLWSEFVSSGRDFIEALVLMILHLVWALKNFFRLFVPGIHNLTVVLRFIMRWSVLWLVYEIHTSNKSFLATAMTILCHLFNLVAVFVKVTTGFDCYSEFFSYFRSKRLKIEWKNVQHMDEFFENKNKNRKKQSKESVS